MSGRVDTVTSLPSRAIRLVGRRWYAWNTNRTIVKLARQVADHVPPTTEERVVFFNASTRLTGLSLNAAFALLSSWTLQLQGAAVTSFVCHDGMTRCVLGTNPNNPQAVPPCRGCIAQSRQIYRHANVVPFGYDPDLKLPDRLANLDLQSLVSFSHEGLPLGSWVLPALRWVLRRHTLPEDEATRFLYRQYILSAWNIASHFSRLLDEIQPACVVVFNGMFYPEAAARHLAQRRGIRVVTHESGVVPYSAFFTPEQATAYPTHIPDSFELTPAQNTKLDAYLAQRFQGDFSMAGIQFWPEMKHLDKDLDARLSLFKKIVPVFTNVVFDTSQPHSNLVFPHMFAWLDLVLDLVKSHPETAFVIRAHPDEFRAGKESRESVRDWVAANHVTELANAFFVDATEYVSSYELINRSSFIMVYNSTIGLEASIMGKPVLCGGKARYTQYATVYFPKTLEAYHQMAEEFLSSDLIEVPTEFRQNARRFLYYLLYKTSLPFNRFLKRGNWPGFVQLQDFGWQALLPENSETMSVITDGILHQKPFIIGEA